MNRGAIVSRLEHLFFIGMSIFDIYIPQEKMNVKKGRLNMITHRLPLSQAPLGFKLTAEDGKSLKVIIEPQR